MDAVVILVTTESGALYKFTQTFGGWIYIRTPHDNPVCSGRLERMPVVEVGRSMFVERSGGGWLASTVVTDLRITTTAA